MKAFLQNIIIVIKVLEEIKDILKAWKKERELLSLQIEHKGEDVWLDSTDVRNLLNIGRTTLYRRREDGAWVAKKIGRKWFYLKSSIH